MKSGDQTDRFYGLVTADGHLSVIVDSMAEAQRVKGTCTDKDYFAIHHVTVVLGDDVNRKNAAWTPVAKKSRKKATA